MKLPCDLTVLLDRIRAFFSDGFATEAYVSSPTQRTRAG